MSARLDLFFQGFAPTPTGVRGRLDLFFGVQARPFATPVGRLDLFFGVTARPFVTPPGRLDLFFSGGAGYPGPPETPGSGGEYIPTFRPRRRM